MSSSAVVWSRALLASDQNLPGDDAAATTTAIDSRSSSGRDGRGLATSTTPWALRASDAAPYERATRRAHVGMAREDPRS